MKTEYYPERPKPSRENITAAYHMWANRLRNVNNYSNREIRGAFWHVYQISLSRKESADMFKLFRKALKRQQFFYRKATKCDKRETVYGRKWRRG